MRKQLPRRAHFIPALQIRLRAGQKLWREHLQRSEVGLTKKCFPTFKLEPSLNVCYHRLQKISRFQSIAHQWLLYLLYSHHFKVELLITLNRNLSHHHKLCFKDGRLFCYSLWFKRNHLCIQYRDYYFVPSKDLGLGYGFCN
jgi:hypothetical protein